MKRAGRFCQMDATRSYAAAFRTQASAAAGFRSRDSAAFQAGPTGLAADPHAGWEPVADCPARQQLGSFLNDSRVAHHLCKAGAAYGTCEALRQQLHGCSGAASGRFTTRLQPRRLLCGVDTCCPHWRNDACWGCGLKWHSPTSVSPPHCPASLPMRWLGRAEIEQCARGKLLIFQGDSLTRQLFNRLIWWVLTLTLTITRTRTRTRT